LNLKLLHKKSEIPTYVGLLISLSFFGYWLIQSITYIPHDYSNSYFGAYFYLKGEFDLKIFDPYSFNKKIYDAEFRNIFASYAPNAPSTALLFIPFALLPLSLSKFIFNLITCVLFLISACRLCKHIDLPAGFVLLIMPVIFFVPIRNEILFGQSYFLLFFLIIEGYLAYEHKRTILTSVLWSLAILIKIFPAIIFVLLLLKKDWKTAISLASFCMLLVISSVLLQGIDIWYEYLFHILPRNSRGEISVAYLTNYQSAHMFFKYAFLQNKDLNPNPLINSNLLFQAFQVIFKSVVLSLCSMAILKQRGVIGFGLLILGVMLLSPYGNTYGNLLLVIILIASYKNFTGKVFWSIVALIFLISNLPLSIFNTLPDVLQFPRLLLYVILLLTVYCALDIKFQWRFFLFFIVILSLPQVFQPKKEMDSSSLLFKEDKQSLIYNYSLRNNRLHYYYWNENGENIHETKMTAQNISYNEVELRQNQIFYKGKQITKTSDNKIKPALLDDNVIIYLSDKDRGIGFYNLRIIKL
jgi:hypothetical protein